MRTTTSHIARALLDIVQGLSAKEVDHVARDVVSLFVRRGQAGALKKILPVLVRLSRERAGVRGVDLTVASEDAQLFQRFKTALSQDGISEKPTVRTDAALIGGCVIQYGDRMIDVSIKSALSALLTHVHS